MDSIYSITRIYASFFGVKETCVIVHDNLLFNCMKNTHCRKKDNSIWILVILCCFALISVVGAFKINYDKVHQLILNNEVEQLSFTTRYLSRLLEREIESQVDLLMSKAKVFTYYQKEDINGVVGRLESYQREMNYHIMGLSDLQGAVIDGNGNQYRLKDDELLQTVTNGDNYIANVLEDYDCMMIAVPIYDNSNNIIGVLWGHFQIEDLSNRIELDEQSCRYFQIVDDSGNYIIDSNNPYSLQKGENVWKELNRYELSDGVTVASIVENFEQNKTGQFHFNYDGEGRYVYYQPLGIHHWYVFSVVLESDITDYIGNVETTYNQLIVWILVCIVIVMVLVGRLVYQAVSYIRKQKQTLEAKNALLNMTLRHTNDIPFAIDLNKGEISFYDVIGKHDDITVSVAKVSPNYILQKGLIDANYLPNYQQIYENIKALKPSPLMPIRFKFSHMWDVKQIYYKILDENKIVGCLEDYNELAQQREYLEEIREKSQRDALTALYNREYFKQFVTNKLSGFKDNPTDLFNALFIVDLDNFKQANDTMGHYVGDQILQDISTRMLKSVSSKDICARLGGDEFVIFAVDVPNLMVIQDISNRLNEALLLHVGEGVNAINITVSIGVAVCQNYVTFDQLYEVADKALYKVKRNGKHSYHIDSALIDPKLLGNVDLNHTRWIKKEFDNALKTNQIEIVWQPIVNLIDSHKVHVEALTRWHHPEYGLVMPSQYIPYLESHQLIDSLDTYVFEKVCQQMNVWQSEMTQDVCVCVNISREHIKYHGQQICAKFTTIANRYGVKPKQILLEITENTMFDLEEISQAKQIVNELKDAGFAVGLDDFGFGYSALSILNELAIDVLKLDKSFFKVSNQRSRLIVENMIHLAHQLNIEVVAEGVETVELFEYLKNMHCDYVQGYVIAKPLSLNDFNHWLKSQNLQKR